MSHKEIELRDKCKICDGHGRILNMARIRMLNLRPKEISLDETYLCDSCNGVGFIDNTKNLKLKESK